MLYFLDSADPDAIREANKVMVKHGFKGLDGITTNPTLVSKVRMTGGTYKSHITYLVNEFGCLDHVSAETLGTRNYDPAACKSEIFYEEGLQIHKWNKHADRPVIVIKVPATPEGLPAIFQLAKEGVKTNATLIFNPNQADLSAIAEATYASPFIGRLDDLKEKRPDLHPYKGIRLVQTISSSYAANGYETLILAASTRTNEHITQSFASGADIVTWRPELFFKFAEEHPVIFRAMRDGPKVSISRWRPLDMEEEKKELGTDIKQWKHFDPDEFYSPKTPEDKPLWQAGNELFLADAKKCGYRVEE